MIFIRFVYCAIILLVLQFVGSAMGGNEEPVKFFASEAESGFCLSLKHRRFLAACCNKNDSMQMIDITKTSKSEGIFHTRGGDRILCYDTKRGRFKSKNRLSFKGIEQCRHLRSRQDRRDNRISGHKRQMECPFSCTDKEVFRNLTGNLQCIFHENMGHGFFYISVEPNAKYLAVRNGRVQKLKRKGKIREPKEKFKRFINLGLSDIDRVKCSP